MKVSIEKPSRRLVRVRFPRSNTDYTYDAGDLELSVNDRVLVPSAMYDEPTIATVVGLGSTYTGAVLRVVRKTEDRLPLPCADWCLICKGIKGQPDPCAICYDCSPSLAAADDATWD